MGTVPVPYVPVAGDDATQARVLTWADAANYLLGNATSGGSKRAMSVMRQTVAQALANSTVVTATFDTEDVDYDNGHSTTTNTSRYTAVTAGWHHVDYLAAFATNATGRRTVWLKVNSVDVNASQVELQAVAVAGQPTLLGGSRLVFLNVGDFLETALFQDSGGAINTVVAGAVACSMCVEWRSN